MVRFGILLYLGFSYALMGLSASEQSFSLERILAAPFPSSLTVSPVESRFAWISSREGVYNLWVTGKKPSEARQLTDYKEDDGLALSILGFTHDGKHILFRREGMFNPSQDPAGTPYPKVFLIAVDGGEPLELDVRGRTILSPATNEVVWVQGDTVHIQGLDQQDKPEKVFAVRGEINSLAWSPDARKLVFSSSRSSGDYNYNFITLYDRDSKTLRYLDPAVYQDGEPRFSPNGKKVAFLRRLRENNEWMLFAREHPQPDPWEIRVVDLETGEVSRLWRSPDNDNLFHFELEWLSNAHLVFISEHSGWEQLYAVGLDGGEPKALTEGGFELEFLHVSSKLGKVFYASNAEDIDRRHMWVVDLSGKPQRLVKGTGNEWSPVPSPDGKWLAFIGAGAKQPAHPQVINLEAAKPKRFELEKVPDDFPSDQLVEPQQAIFKAADGVEIHGQLFLPPDHYEGKRPAVMYFHGGPVRQMLLGFHYSQYYHRAYAMNQYLASRGYVVLAVNFRSGVGYGRAFRDVPDAGPRGASEYRDLLAGAAYLRGMERVDSARIGLWGGSYGGLMTALGLARNSDLFAAGVDLHGVHDWNQWQAGVQDTEYEHDVLAWKSSPIADVESWRSPVLLIHGDDDRNVPFSETIWLTRKLREQGVEAELMVMPDEPHSFLLHRNWVKALKATAAFFDRKLKP